MTISPLRTLASMTRSAGGRMRGVTGRRLRRRSDPHAGSVPRLRWLTDDIVAVGGSADDDAATLVRVPTAVGRVGVVAVEALDPAAVVAAVGPALPLGTPVCLYVDDAGRPGADGTAPADVLVEWLGAEVVAPLGPVELGADGAAFATAVDGGWLRFSGSVLAEPLGRRWPEPEWGRLLDETPLDQRHGLRLVPVPAGLWLLPDDGRQPHPGDAAYAVPADPQVCGVLIGRPGDLAPAVSAVIDLLDQLPPAVGERLLVIPYGCGVELGVAVATGLSRRWAAPVAAATGVPVAGDDAIRTVVGGADGGGWRPLVPRLRCAWPEEPRPERAPECLTDLATDGTGAHLLDEQAGRPVAPPVDPPAEPAVARHARPGPDDDGAAARTGADCSRHWLADDLALLMPSDRAASVAALDPGLVAAARSLRRSAGEVTLLNLADRVDFTCLAGEPALAAEPRRTVRLVASGAAAHAATLAGLLAAPVIAPVGEVLLVPGGSTFAIGPGWRRVTADGTATPARRRHPSVSWEDAVDAVVTGYSTVDGSGVVPIPAGLWIHGGGAVPPPLDDLAFAVPVLPDRVAIVIGAPGRPEPTPATVADVVGRLPHRVRDQVVLVPHGLRRRGCLAAARALARRWERPVALATGLPVLADDRAPGDWQTVVVDDAGAPLWRHPVRLLSCPAAGPPTVLDQPSFLADLAATAPGTYRLTGRWLVRVTHVGAWLGPESDRVDTEDVEWDATRFTVVLGDNGGGTPDESEAVFGELVRRLPPPVRRRVHRTTRSTGAPQRAAEPQPAADELPSVAVPAPTVPAREPAVFNLGHESTPEQRRTLRAALGWRYDAHASGVSRLLASRPGLRAGASAAEELVTDLVAVRAFACGDAGDLVPRSGSGPDEALLGCVVSGLRRLPSQLGPVVLRESLPALDREPNHPGTTLVERGLLLGRAARPQPAPDGGARAVVWSTSGRRLAGLVDGVDDLVMFAPGTRFRVLHLDAPDDAPAVVYLLGETADIDRQADERILARLREWAC